MEKVKSFKKLRYGWEIIEGMTYRYAKVCQSHPPSKFIIHLLSLINLQKK